MAEESGMNKGWAVAVIGILIVIAVLAIKMSASGDTSEFMGITNPEGVYGEYFMAGIGIGVIVLIIGGVMATMTGEPAEEEEEFEEEMTMEEEYGEEDMFGEEEETDEDLFSEEETEEDVFGEEDSDEEL